FHLLPPRLRMAEALVGPFLRLASARTKYAILTKRLLCRAYSSLLVLLRWHLQYKQANARARYPPFPTILLVLDGFQPSPSNRSMKKLSSAVMMTSAPA